MKQVAKNTVEITAYNSAVALHVQVRITEHIFCYTDWLTPMYTSFSPFIAAAVGEGSIRLVGIGSTALEGRLEIFHGGDWGTICDDYFGTVDARVVCRQLGFNAVAGFVTDDRYGIGKRLINEG